jgi:hypothetical protein
MLSPEIDSPIGIIGSCGRLKIDETFQSSDRQGRRAMRLYS